MRVEEGKPQGKDDRSGPANALTNPRHEASCQRMALGDYQTEAAKLAGTESSHLWLMLLSNGRLYRT